MNRVENLLATLGEECGEVQQAVGKALRFGVNDGYPTSDTTNLEDIQNEVADLLGVYEMLMKEVAQSESVPHYKRNRKKLRVEEYMEYSRRVGALND